jgi:chorismate dehydratase
MPASDAGTNTNHPIGKADSPFRVGAVAYLNSRPLVCGLEGDPNVEVRYDVPARLPRLLDDGCVDAALTPVIDLLDAGRTWKVVSDACIGCDGETLTVRVFSRVPPDRVRRLWVDPASHTSVLLARLIWRECHDCPLAVEPLPDPAATDPCDAVLLIGDKVITAAPYGFTYQMDLGAAWKSLTGLPFVFAVWAARESTPTDALASRLAAARDRGVARAAEIARAEGPQHGWPAGVAERYLTRNLSFTLTARHRTGMDRFLALGRAHGLLPVERELVFA